MGYMPQGAVWCGGWCGINAWKPIVGRDGVPLLLLLRLIEGDLSSGKPWSGHSQISLTQFCFFVTFECLVVEWEGSRHTVTVLILHLDLLPSAQVTVHVRRRDHGRAGGQVLAASGEVLRLYR
jgi:hypothetical protein